MRAETRISVRVSPQLKKDIETTVAFTGIEEAVLVRQGLAALVKYVKENQSITFPLAIIPAPTPEPILKPAFNPITTTTA